MRGIPLFAFFLAVMCCRAADLTVLPEHFRPDPFGNIVIPDRESDAAPARTIVLDGARAGYVSCHILASVPEGGEYSFEVAPPADAGGLEVELYREWFHFVPKANAHYPDALVTLHGPYRSRMPEPDNRIAGQTVQAFWLDVWIPSGARPGTYRLTAILKTAKQVKTLPVDVRVLNATIPAEDVVAIDHNTYGTSWFATQYPELLERSGSDFFSSETFFNLIHAYHRIFYEHRGVFHQLGYGHAGKVGPEFAPKLEGEGRKKHIADWSLYDRHYRPLFDGSAFAGTHRGARPIPFVYLPINPEWPASFLWYGEPGYEREFVNVVSEMERHFRENGWTDTRFELFFNHKKRYKGFLWDGDETRFPTDYRYFREYARLMKLAVPADTPVKFVYRADVSWTMERQFKELAGVIDMWVCGGGMFRWYDYAPKLLKGRGDIVWIYGGTPLVTEPSSHITLDVLRPWVLGVDGFVRWLTTAPGPDPWFHFQGGGETLVYPGERFGIEGPIPSIRLKLQRNAVQDLTLLNSLGDLETIRVESVRRINRTRVADWWIPRPKLAGTDPVNWTNADIDDAIPKDPRFTEALDAAAWQRVRSYVLERAREVK